VVEILRRIEAFYIMKARFRGKGQRKSLHVIYFFIGMECGAYLKRAPA
jgi:hypothetical protein